MKNNTIMKVSPTICSGCGLCTSVCPKSCISMHPDKEGFLSPVVNEDICVDCGLCLKSCPAVSDGHELLYKSERKYYASIISNKDMLIKSSSGGMFGILAEHFLQIGGYVCGCVYNEDMEAVHVVTDKRDIVLKMYGSKYVQSRAFGCFSKIKELLRGGASVLFVGTACQIAACRSFLGKDYERLLCVEILCHGVPSPGLFAEYVCYLEKKLGGKVVDIRFRDKEKHGWGSEHRTCVVYEKKGVLKKHRPFLPAYFSSFFYGLNLRESCYNCKFAKLERVADLTIGDYWGYWPKYGRRFEEGISVVGVNSEKGLSFVDALKDNLELFDELTEREAIRSNDNFEHPVKRPSERTGFYKSLGNVAYRGLWKKTYFTRTYRRKTLASVYGAVVPAKIRFLLHKKKK